ncbi:MAG: GNAT family N-acetyltransferase [Burkholderiaceae bacterium]
MPETSIRSATVDDATDCSAILCDSIRTLCVPDHENNDQVLNQWLSNKTPDVLLQWIQAPSTEIYVVERNGEIVGVGGILRRGEVALNYVSPGARFSGVSRQLLTHMEAALQAFGIPTGTLTSTKTAHRFYRAAGWHDVGEPQQWGDLTAFPMEKSLEA